MKRFFTKILGGGLIISAFLLLGCTDENLSPDEITDQFADGLPIRLTPADYNEENTYYLLNDDEPSTVFFNQNERSFYADQPIQMTIDDDLWFQIRFYSPRALTNVTVWAKIEGYEEEFKLFVFEKLMPFQQFRMQLPFAERDLTAATRSGKLIQIMANPHMAKENISVELECDAPYYQTLKSIKSHCFIRFQDYTYDPKNYGDWPLRAYQAREGVAFALNIMYMFSSPEFEAALKAWGPLYSATNVLVDKDKLLQQALGHSILKFGCVHRPTVLGLGGGGIYCLADDCFYQHYPDDRSYTESPFHEFAHCIGYSHNGNMTYGGTTGWTALCDSMYVALGLAKKLPVYSRRFLQTRRTAKNKYNSTMFYPSRHIIEDPELDAIDGGLGRGEDFLDTDWGEKEGAPALSFKLDYNNAEAPQKDYMPRGIYVYGDKMYVSNDIRRGNYSLEIYDLSTGKPVLEKSIKQFTLPNGNTINTDTPADILRSHDKFYVVGSNNAVFAFDAKTYECTAMIGIGFDAVGLAATNGIVYAHKGLTRAFIEHIPNGYVATSDNLAGGANDAMTADYAGNVYAVCYDSKKMVQLNNQRLMGGKLTSDKELTFEFNPLGAAWSADGRLFVSFAGTDQKFCEVDPKTGKIIKNYTTIGDITLNNPAKCLIRRNTLFIVDRKGGLCVYAIPLSQLN
ncbi:MAG: hypothetical protein K2L06_03210 [Alistipes sp.]|nr:hypothetical protein [Alistipes sp.]